MLHALTVKVHYPLGRSPETDRDRLVLRSGLDWDRDLEPAAITANGTEFRFELELAEPFVYFKPVLRRAGETIWAQGENHLALADESSELEVYPYFFNEPGCSACAVRHLPSLVSGRDHALRVFLPPGYVENSLARYPVLYMQDGQNLFFAAEAFGGHHWMIAETLRVLDAMSLMRKALVVGIYPQDRLVDYTLPGYAEYGRYCAEELKPWVDEHYRTLSGPTDTAIMGSSLGGVVSLAIAWQWPELFGAVGCLSSSFGYRDNLHERIETEAKPPLKIYLDSGWPGDNYEATRTLRNTLRSRGFREGLDLLYLAFPNARHDETAWSIRAHIPFQFFFSR